MGGLGSWAGVAAASHRNCPSGHTSGSRDKPEDLRGGMAPPRQHAWHGHHAAGKAWRMRPDILNPLFAPVSSLEGVGPKLEKALTRLLRGNEHGEPARIANLLFHLPHRRDRPAQPAWHCACAQWCDRDAESARRPAPARRRAATAACHRASMCMTRPARWRWCFSTRASTWVAKNLPVGETRYVSGKVEWFNGRPGMVHPDHVVDEAGLCRRCRWSNRSIR